MGPTAPQVRPIWPSMKYVNIAPDKAVYCVSTHLLEQENAIKFISVRTKTQ